ncbi:MAG: hypothetical protein HQL11_04880, partial [Candidatus Omnitrophica bacterium]|nr:hypothetical protein [Candidatus Omnitrophota bacterium]
MPFPVAVKILRLAGKKAKGFIPYFESDPAHYHDAVINASMADVIRVALGEMGFKHVSFVTHGIGDRSSDTRHENQTRVAQVISDIEDTEIGVSLHIAHDPVINVFVQKWNDRDQPQTAAELAERIDAMRRSYVDRFVSLIGAAVSSQKKMNLRYFEAPDKEIMEIIASRYPGAAFVLGELQTLQDSVFAQVRDEIRARYDVDIDTRDKDEEFESSTRVVWTDDAALMLHKLAENADHVDFGEYATRNIPDLEWNFGGEPTGAEKDFRATLARINELQRLASWETPSIVPTRFSVSMEPDLHDTNALKVVLQTKESHMKHERFRTVHEMFGAADETGQWSLDPARRESFLSLLYFVQLCLDIDWDSPRTGMGMKKTRAAGKYGNLPVPLQAMAREKINEILGEPERKRGYVTDDNVPDDELDDKLLAMSEVVVSPEWGDYLKIVLAFFVDAQRLSDLLNDPERNIEALFGELGEVPFSVDLQIQFLIKNITHLWGGINLVDEGHPAYAKNPYRSLRKFSAHVNYEPVTENASGAAAGSRSAMDSSMSSAVPGPAMGEMPVFFERGEKRGALGPDDQIFDLPYAGLQLVIFSGPGGIKYAQLRDNNDGSTMDPVPLAKGETYTVGRAIERHLQVGFKYPSVSRHQADIVVTEDAVTLRDFGRNRISHRGSRPPRKRDSSVIKAPFAPLPVGTDWQEVPFDDAGLVDLDKLFTPARFPTHPELMGEIVYYIRRYIRDPEKMRYALLNLANPALMPYIVQARRHNILLVISREIANPEILANKFGPYLDALNQVFGAIPAPLLWETYGPIGFEVTETAENVFGFQGKMDSVVGGGIDVSMFEEQPDSMRLLPQGDMMEFNRHEMMRTVVHEILGHRRSFAKRPRYRMTQALQTIQRIEGEFELTMDHTAWRDVGRANGVTRLVHLTDELKDA